MNASSDRDASPENIRIRMAAGREFPCSELFGRGVRVGARTGVGIRELLCTQLGVEKTYLEERIQTVFLNGRPVDDVTRSRVDDGDILSLSAAMPGLVGATLRRGGHLAAFRKNISHSGSQRTEEPGSGTVTIKLFNMVARELGPGFLQRGVIVAGRDLPGPLRAAERNLEALERNGAPVAANQLADLLDSDRDVLLQVESAA